MAERVYSRSDTSRLDEYQKLRYRVLFEVWFPRSESVVLRSVMCRQCGMVIYTPRPEEHDLRAKYAFLARLGPEPTKLSPTDPAEIRRSVRMSDYVCPFLPSGSARVLDFGGGDGRLITDLVRRGCRGFVVDFETSTLPGIQRLGSTAEDLPADAAFDVVICSHVLEHVADPLDLLDILRGHLTREGLLYVEVPLEIWKGAPLQDEPVTHINFFTRHTLESLLRQTGYAVRRSHVPRVTQGGETSTHVVQGWATRTDTAASPNFSGGPEATRRLLHPSWVLRMSRAAHYPRYWRGILRRRLLRKAGGAGA